MSQSESEKTAEVLREEVEGDVSFLGGAMMGIADCFTELAYGAGRGFGVHAEYRASNLNTGKPIKALAQELAVWAAMIAKKAGELDANREALKRRETDEG
ncbi:hypothetical protein ACEZDB_35615 [Streptacidiphilus sp. N1-3]|uniref:Uncharacterized protein n=1 Tax=Streptacidiphilus alkalitolerans TaxID=3342712 RepID=A0ABV6XDG1_9ACTN